MVLAGRFCLETAWCVARLRGAPAWAVLSCSLESRVVLILCRLCCIVTLWALSRCCSILPVMKPVLIRDCWYFVYWGFTALWMLVVDTRVSFGKGSLGFTRSIFPGDERVPVPSFQSAYCLTLRRYVIVNTMWLLFKVLFVYKTVRVTNLRFLFAWQVCLPMSSALRWQTCPSKS